MADNLEYRQPGVRLIAKKDLVTLEQLQKTFPKKKNSIGEKTVELINATLSDPEFNGTDLIQTLHTFENVMYNNSAAMEEYVNAVRFCAYLETNGDNIIDAYKKTFYFRDFVKNGLDKSFDTPEYMAIQAAASRYRKNKVVVDILAMADVPLYLLFQGHRYKAVEVLASEMMSAPLAKDRIAAAEKLLTHVKPPENSKLELNIGMSASAMDVASSLNDQLTKLAEQQKALLAQGHNIKDVQRLGINLNNKDVIDVEVDE